MQITGYPHVRKQPLATFSSGKKPNGRDVWEVPRPRYTGSCSCNPPYGSRLSPAQCCIVQGTAVWGGEGGTVVARVFRVPEYLGTWLCRWQGSRAGGARTTPSPKRGWVARARARALVQGRPCFPVLQCSCHLRPAGPSGLLGQPVGPPNRTKQPVNISVGGLGSPLLVPSPVSSRTYVSGARLFFCLVRIASYHVCLGAEHGHDGVKLTIS